MRTDVSLERRRELVSVAVTLDGKPAAICGWKNRFATVAALDGSATFEWSWRNVATVVTNGGAFTTGGK